MEKKIYIIKKDSSDVKSDDGDFGNEISIKYVYHDNIWK
jgi:hypothetical protein